MMRPFKIHKISCPLKHRQELLLKAALLEGDDAIEAWHAWKKDVALDSLDPNSLRLLPLLGKNMTKHEISDPLMEPLLKFYRYNSLRNQGFLRDMAKPLELLQKRGISVMVLKGMALALGYYGDVGARPMHDLDFLVKPGDALKAIELLAGYGWRTNPEKGDPFDGMNPGDLLARHFKNKFGTQIDLHWFDPLGRGIETDDSYWKGAVELKALGKSILVMNPTDMLFFTMAHGIKHRGANAPRMITDMHTILVKAAPDIKWGRLAAAIKKAELVLPARAIFRYLNNLLHTPIPGGFQNHLDSIRVPSSAWHTFHALNNLPAWAVNFINSCMSLANEYQVTKRARAARPPGVAEYLKLRWGLNHVREVPRTFVAKAGHHIFQGRNP